MTPGGVIGPENSCGNANNLERTLHDRHFDMNTPQPEALLLTEREAAKMMAISASQLAKMRYRGEIQAVHWGYRCIRYTVEEIRAAISRATKSHAEIKKSRPHI